MKTQKFLGSAFIGAYAVNMSTCSKSLFNDTYTLLSHFVLLPEQRRKATKELVDVMTQI